MRDNEATYLHFLDRELLRFASIYERVSYRRLHDDIRVALLSTNGISYVSLSVLFESSYATKSVLEDALLFQHPEILQVASSVDSIPVFIDRKRFDYADRHQEYPGYYSDLWKEIEDIGPLIHRKRGDTTEVLRTLVPDHLGNATYTEIEALKEILTGESPVTIGNISSRIQESQLLSSKRDHICRAISESYVRVYADALNADLPINLATGASVFDDAVPLERRRCIRCWREFYAYLGLYPGMLEWSPSEIIALRSSNAYKRVVRLVGEWQSKNVKNKKIGFRDLLLKIRPRLSTLDISRVGLFERLERMISTFMEPPSSPVVPGKRKLRLFPEDCAIKLHDGRVVRISKRATDVLHALLRGKKELKGTCVSFILPDGVVSQLYSEGDMKGTDAQICQQFLRYIRKILKDVGILDRNAVVKRVRNDGIEVGDAWASYAIGGKSEASLFFFDQQGFERLHGDHDNED
jgi:hypothetical protein